MSAGGHKVVTFERQGGYAARCDTCGDATFGGFATRTEARAALTHEDGPAAEATAGGPETESIPNQEEGTTMSILSDPEVLLEWRDQALAVLNARKAELRADVAFTAWADQEIEQARRDLALRGRDEFAWTMDECLAKAVTHNLPDLPAPGSLPSWASEFEIDTCSYCEVELIFRRELVDGDLDASMLQIISLDVITGEMDVPAPTVRLSPYEDLDGVHAARAAALLATAADMLAGRTDAPVRELRRPAGATAHLADLDG